MSYLAEGHLEWHLANGIPSGDLGGTCPLDACGHGWEHEYNATDGATVGIRCGACDGRHSSPRVVRACHALREAHRTDTKPCGGCGTRIPAEAAGCADCLAAPYEACEHGLSAQLCAGPGHYPADL